MVRDRNVQRLAASCLVLLLAAAAGPVRAQLPGVPTLQNAFSNPGLTIAGNAGFGSASSSYAFAGAWAPFSGRLQVSAGAGLYTPDKASGRGAWGLRASSSFISAMGGALGVGGFAGVGGAGGGGDATGTPISESPGGEAVTTIPVGATIGYRRALGSSRGVSIYGAPMFTWFSRGGSNDTNGSVFRLSAGIDFGISRAFGITAGAEFGQSAEALSLGPRGTIIGVGLSYALGAR